MITLDSQQLFEMFMPGRDDEDETITAPNDDCVMMSMMMMIIMMLLMFSCGYMFCFANHLFISPFVYVTIQKFYTISSTGHLLYCGEVVGISFLGSGLIWLCIITTHALFQCFSLHPLLPSRLIMIYDVIINTNEYHPIGYK